MDARYPLAESLMTLDESLFQAAKMQKVLSQDKIFT
jgi:hypothetical protein